MDPRVERLDPPVEHLGEAGHGRDVGHRQAGLAQRPCRAAGRHELEPEPTSPSRTGRGPTCPTPTAARGAATGTRAVGAVEVERTGGRPPPERTGDDLRHRPRQQLVLGRPDPFVERRLVVAGQDRDRLLGHDRPAVERVVDEVDRAAGDRDAVRERVADGVGAGERRQQRRMRVEDPPAERGQDLRADDRM